MEGLDVLKDIGVSTMNDMNLNDLLKCCHFLLPSLSSRGTAVSLTSLNDFDDVISSLNGSR